jgi:hypothetical protein
MNTKKNAVLAVVAAIAGIDFFSGAGRVQRGKGSDPHGIAGELRTLGSPLSSSGP